MTSRDQRWAVNLATTIELQSLDESATTDWLLEATFDSDRLAATDLARELDGLPLAVVQAISYLRQSPTESIASYLEEFRVTAARLLSQGQPHNYPRTVATTWEMSISESEYRVRGSRELLRELSHLSPDYVPVDWIDHLHGEEGRRRLSQLHRYSLIRVQRDHVSMHRLVQEVTRSGMTSDEQLTAVMRLRELLAQAVPEASGRPDPELWAWLLANVELLTSASFKLDCINAEMAAVLLRTGTSLNDLADHRAAATILHRAVSAANRVHGERSLESAKALNNLGVAYRESGDIERAVSIYEQALSTKETLLGQDDPQLVSSLNTLANALRQQGAYDQALGLLERALEILAKVTDGSGDLNRAITLLNLGTVHMLLGDNARRAESFEQSLEQFEASVGDHPYTSFCLLNLANARRDMRDFDEAGGLYKAAIVRLADSPGLEHPDYALARANHAEFLAMVHGPESGIRELGAARRALVRHYGWEHPHVIDTLLTEASLIVETGRFFRLVRKVAVRADQLSKAVFGEGHPNQETVRILLEKSQPR